MKKEENKKNVLSLLIENEKGDYEIKEFEIGIMTRDRNDKYNSAKDFISRYQGDSDKIYDNEILDIIEDVLLAFYRGVTIEILRKADICALMIGFAQIEMELVSRSYTGFNEKAKVVAGNLKNINPILKNSSQSKYIK